MNDGMNAPRVNADGLGQSVLAEIHRLEKFFVENLPWMNGRQPLGVGCLLN